MMLRLLAVTAVCGLSMTHAFADAAKVEKVTFTNHLENTKKVWTTSAPHVKAGKVEMTLTNTLDDPHGFTLVTTSADGKTQTTVVEPLIVNAHETKTVTLDVKEGSYDFKCQMHPAHVGGHLVVIK